MRLYDCTADCLVDFCTLHYIVVAKNVKDAWIKAYIHFNNSSVADVGSVDAKRVTDYSKITKIHK